MEVPYLAQEPPNQAFRGPQGDKLSHSLGEGQDAPVRTQRQERAVGELEEIAVKLLEDFKMGEFFKLVDAPLNKRGYSSDELERMCIGLCLECANTESPKDFPTGAMDGRHPSSPLVPNLCVMLVPMHHIGPIQI